MIRPNVAIIAAVGASGQIGLDDALPWPREQGDLPWFRAMTVGNAVVLGGRTARHVGPLSGRLVKVWDGRADPAAFLDLIDATAPGFTIFIAGGAQTWRSFAPFASKWIVTRIAYDGPADTFWPFALPWRSA